MSIVFLVLKIIFFIFIGLLILILFISGLILFMPIKYKIIVNYNKGLDINADFSWLFRFLSYKYELNEAVFKSDFKIMFISPGKKKDKQEEKEENIENKEYKRENEEKYSDKEIKTEPIKVSDTEEMEAEEDGDSKVEERLSKEALKGFKALAEKLKGIWYYPDRDEIIRRTKDFLIICYKRIKPRKFMLTAEVGFEDRPDLTGKLLGAYAIINTKINKPYIIDLQGNFNEDMMKISLNTYGYVYLGLLLIPFVRYIFSKPIWKVVKKYI